MFLLASTNSRKSSSDDGIGKATKQYNFGTRGLSLFQPTRYQLVSVNFLINEPFIVHTHYRVDFVSQLPGDKQLTLLGNSHRFIFQFHIFSLAVKTKQLRTTLEIIIKNSINE